MPHTETKYDEGIQGPSVAWYNTRLVNDNGTNKPLLYGAPKLHTTGITPTDPTWMARDFTTNAAPITVDSGNDNIAFSATGKIVFPQTGTYMFRYWHDDGARLYIDDTSMFPDADWWHLGETQIVSTASFNAVAGKVYRFRLDFVNRNAQYANEAWLSGPGITDTSGSGYGTNHWGTYVRPDYNLTTSTKTYDATPGNSTATTGYGSNPELGLAQTSSVDPTGLNLTTTSTYETQGATGSFLRQLTKTLPGGAQTNYSYYTATETRDDPCTTATEAYKEGGRLKIKTEPDPDGSGSQTGRASETIYDDAGRAVAVRYNSENWTCVTYDSRGRVTQTHVQAFNGNSDRTITNNYAVSGNPLQTATYDEQGWVITDLDLLGRTTAYTDTWGNWTGYEYDALGNVTRKYGDMGEEIFYYDSYNRLTTHIFDGVTYANVTYDIYGRTDHIDYPAAGQLRLTIGRDALGRVNSNTYRKGDGTTGPTDSITLSQSNQVVSGTENGNSKSYTYDGAGRLTAATLGLNTYSYGFGTESSSCNSLTSNNTNAGKSSNRTTQTVNGTTTYFCYDQADRLIGSGNSLYNTPTYDSRGNMTTLGTGSTPLNMGYDSSDRSSYFTQLTSAGTGTGYYYNRDVNSRITYREKDTISTWNWTLAAQYFYGFTGLGDAPDFVRDANWTVTEKYLQLPGGVTLTVRPAQTGNAQKTYSLSNIHGDNFASTNAAGTILTTTLTGPFGETISGQTNPNNTLADSTFSYVGKHEKITETAFALAPIEMGARVYIPGLGRFTSVDPIDGGTPSNYVYPPDAVNDFDLSGTIGWKKWFSDRNKNINNAAAKWYRAQTGAEDWCARNKACNIGAFAITIRGGGKNEFSIGTKIEKQMETRGWSGQRISQAIKSPAKKVPTSDTRYTNTGQRLNQPATAYYHKDGGYVVRNNNSGDIVQVSNLNKADWKAPWD